VSGEFPPVRPTRLCVTALDVPIPTLDIRLHDLDHVLIKEAQRIPEVHAADGAERILSIADRVWLKVKTGRWRGAATRLSEADGSPDGPPTHLAPWWLGAAGYRRKGDHSDFYETITNSSSSQWLPTVWDWKRLELEHAVAWEREIRDIVCGLIARSLRTGQGYQAVFKSYSITALARANGGETYLVIGAENIADPKVFAVIMNAVPGIAPEGVAGITPESGEIIWSTILPPAVACSLLDMFAPPDQD
jgi:hypothetical protein